MIKQIDIEIDGIDYTLPEYITVTHYGEMMRRMSLSETATEQAYDIIGVLLNIPYQVLREIDPEQLADLSVYLQHKVTSCDGGYVPSFTHKGVKYVGLNFNKITFGEYVDVVNMIKTDISIYMNIHKIAALLYRPEVDGNIAPYDIDAHELQSELFKDLPLQYFFGIFSNLFAFLTQMKKDFVVLFGEEEDEDRPKQPKEETDEDAEQSNLPYYKMIMVLAAEDFTKIDYVTSRPLVECFNHLTYIKIKIEEQKQQLLKQQNKMNL
jgi:hypothetical protein